MTANIDQFPSCCGASILHDLSGMTSFQLKAVIRKAKADNKGALIAITAPRQVGPAELLRDAGFKSSGTFVNPSSSNRLRIWTLKLNQPRN